MSLSSRKTFVTSIHGWSHSQMTKYEPVSPSETISFSCCTTQHTCDVADLRVISKDRVTVGEVEALPRSLAWDDAFTNGGWSVMPEII